MEKPRAEEAKEPYPKAIYFILGNEFCERFTYYGIRTIASLYLTQYLLYSEATSMVVFHFFVMLSYFTPLLGAILADSWLGKYRTILYLSVLYAIGNVVVSAGAVPASLNTMRAVSILGFVVVGFGTGGIKPCVSAFGGDQFSHNQKEERKRFFSIFYFVINSGSVISTLVTPELRADVSCLGEDTCYPLAFGVPALLMLLSIVLFVAGKSLYVMTPVTGNAVVRVCKCIWHAIVQRSRSKDKKKEHFLEYAEDQYEKSFIEDVKSVLHVLWIFLPLPIFWTLFDQTSSRWTLQATKLNGEVWGMHIKADQMQAVNPIMILVFIPVFDYLVYPALTKCNLLTKPLQRMSVGGFITAISFVMAAFLEMACESSVPLPPPAGHTSLYLLNNAPCQLQFNSSFAAPITMEPFQYESAGEVSRGEVRFSARCGDLTTEGEQQATLEADWEVVVATLQGGKLRLDKAQDPREKSKSGEPRVRVAYSTGGALPANSSLLLQGARRSLRIPAGGATSDITPYAVAKPGTYELFFPDDSARRHEAHPVGSVHLVSGGSYIVAAFRHGNATSFKVWESVEPNSVSILLQIPQYIVITAGEIMFSITGLEFSYSQAPLSLKSVVQSAWLLTVAFGNLIVMIVAELHLFSKMSYELLMYAALMALDMVVFVAMAYFYRYRFVLTHSQEELQQIQRKDDHLQ